MFEDKEEKRLAREMAKKYIDEYTFESVSDKNALKQLVFLEILSTRLQSMLNDSHRDNKAIPMQLMDALHKNIKQIVDLKTTLGLTKDKDDESKTDAYKALDTTKKKFKVWCDENQASRTIVCPECSKLVLLRIRTDAWEAQKHPYFKDRLLYNQPLFDLFKDGKITADDVAKILGCSPDYIHWIIEKTSVKVTEKSSDTSETVTEEPQQSEGSAEPVVS
jgi:DNA-directed RNA polymerase subunit RPC12/RpoP